MLQFFETLSISLAQEFKKIAFGGLFRKINFNVGKK
jgi:hypothetical protein